MRLPRILSSIATHRGFSNATLASSKMIRNDQTNLVLDESYINKFDEVLVVGDIHGCNDEFHDLLQRVHLDTPSRKPSKCLKILAGDLVNKGPNSPAVLEMCCDGQFADSILAVRGNHDDIVVSQHEKFKYQGESANLIEQNKWIESLPEAHVAYLENLPLTISIPSLNAVIVHAGLDPSLEDPIKDTPDYLKTTMRNIIVKKSEVSGKLIYLCTKENQGEAWAKFWLGPQHVYFGHDAKRRLQDGHKFATGLDTGCVYGDRLSYVYLKGSKKGRIFSIKAKRQYEAMSEKN